MDVTSAGYILEFGFKFLCCLTMSGLSKDIHSHTQHPDFRTRAMIQNYCIIVALYKLLVFPLVTVHRQTYVTT